jgi:hypothetical protein
MSTRGSLALTRKAVSIFILWHLFAIATAAIPRPETLAELHRVTPTSDPVPFPPVTAFFNRVAMSTAGLPALLLAHIPNALQQLTT